MKAPFVRRNGTFVLLAKNVPYQESVQTTTGVLIATTEKGLSSGVPDEIQMDEGRIPESLPVPERPSSEAIAKHMLTHMPYASWCQDCVMGRATENAHKRLNREPSATPTIAADYCFLSLTDKPEAERKESDADNVTVLVTVDSLSGYEPEPWSGRAPSPTLFVWAVPS